MSECKHGVPLYEHCDKCQWRAVADGLAARLDDVLEGSNWRCACDNCKSLRLKIRVDLAAYAAAKEAS